MSEIERKFLVNQWKPTTSGTQIIQGYLNRNPIIRVRIYGDVAFLTIKSNNIGIVRDEYEYMIPLTDAYNLLKLCNNIIKKTRYKEGRWEIDVFEENNKGLIIAEIELNDINEEFDKPSWLGEEVTNNPRYYNVNLFINKALKQYENKIMSLLKWDDLDSGFSCAMDILLDECLEFYNKDIVWHWLKDLYTKYKDNHLFVCTLLHVLSHYEYEEVFYLVDVAKESLTSDDSDVVDYALKAFDNWNAYETLDFLNTVTLKEKYQINILNDIITNIKKED